MSVTSNATKTIAFLGATGGCTNACLAHLLLSDLNYKAIALARTPQKLIASLLRQPGITDAIIADKLTIIQGDATEVSAVKKILLVQKDSNKNNDEPALVDGIVSGIGGSPQRVKGTLLSFTLDNPHITEEGATALVVALQETYAEKGYHLASLADDNKPFLAVVSTTGIGGPNDKEDVPFLFQWMYHHLLAEPHADKKKMEAIFTSDKNAALFKGVILTKPSLLTGDGLVNSGKGLANVKVGTADEPAVGYFMRRADVGEWIWEKVCKNGGRAWFGKKVTLTN